MITLFPMKPLLALLVGLALASGAQAAGLGLRAGTTGIGADVAWKVAPALNARLGYSALKWGFDVDTANVRYDGELELSKLNAFVDFTPLGPLFRLTGGLLLNRSRYDVRGAHAGGGALSGTVEPRRAAAPYLGIGWGNVAGAGVNFYADLGIVFQGAPRASLQAECGALGAAACAQLRSELAAEQARLEDELDRFKYYPVLNLGITIGF